MTFEEAYHQLHHISQQLQSDEMVDLDTIISLQQEAKKLYELCMNIVDNVPKSSLV